MIWSMCIHNLSRLLFFLLFSFMGCLIYLSYLCILNFALRQRGNKCWNKKLSNKQKKKRWTAIMLRICNGIEMLWGDLWRCCSLQLILSMCCHDGPGVKASMSVCALFKLRMLSVLWGRSTEPTTDCLPPYLPLPIRRFNLSPKSRAFSVFCRSCCCLRETM